MVPAVIEPTCASSRWREKLGSRWLLRRHSWRSAEDLKWRRTPMPPACPATRAPAKMLVQGPVAIPEGAGKDYECRATRCPGRLAEIAAVGLPTGLIPPSRRLLSAKWIAYQPVESELSSEAAGCPWPVPPRNDTDAGSRLQPVVLSRCCRRCRRLPGAVCEAGQWRHRKNERHEFQRP